MSNSTLSAILSSIPDETLVSEMENRGFQVHDSRFGGWQTMASLAHRVKREVNSLSRTITRAIEQGIEIPGFEAKRGPSGRILQVRITDQFTKWLASLSKRS